MARDPSTYRAARRNLALRTLKTVWGPEFYYAGHRLTAHKRGAVPLSRRPSRYHLMEMAGTFLRSLGKRWIGRRKAAA